MSCLPTFLYICVELLIFNQTAEKLYYFALCVGHKTNTLVFSIGDNTDRDQSFLHRFNAYFFRKQFPAPYDRPV